MSTNLAETMPLGLPAYEPRREEQPRHIEIVSTRSQRRARPRPIYAIVIVGGLFVLFIAQLLMSIVVSNGAYQISGLQAEQRTLTQTANALGEQADLLASPQSLTSKADALGMVYSDQTPNFVVLKNGKIIGDREGVSNTSDLNSKGIPNELLVDAKRAENAAKAKAKAEAKKLAAATSDATPTQ
jgi:cell division protein FtsB